MHNQNQAVGKDKSKQLILFGVALFNLGLITGLLIPLMANARMGLSSHLEGIINGMVLVILGLAWSRIQLGVRGQNTLYYLAIYGTYANWFATLLAGFIGAGGSMMPIAASNYLGTALQEGLIAFALMSLSFAMLVVGGLVFWGISRFEKPLPSKSQVIRA
jgi:hydroxylaminobenzene mutase